MYVVLFTQAGAVGAWTTDTPEIAAQMVDEWRVAKGVEDADYVPAQVFADNGQPYGYIDAEGSIWPGMAPRRQIGDPLRYGQPPEHMPQHRAAAWLDNMLWIAVQGFDDEYVRSRLDQAIRESRHT